jgi:hypothetical protein
MEKINQLIEKYGNKKRAAAAIGVTTRSLLNYRKDKTTPIMPVQKLIDSILNGSPSPAPGPGFSPPDDAGSNPADVQG